MKSNRKLGSLIGTIVIFFSLMLVYLNRIAIYDWWRLRDYQPSAKIVKLVKDDTMTDYAKHMFYINRPQIQNKAEFNQSCPNDGGEQTIILGCYHDHQTGIYLYSVTDPKLDGVEQVTAAHETLHAVYDRLSSKDKAYVDGLLQDYYKNELKDKRIKQTIAAYKKTETNDLVNEMHSIFGTELIKLPPALEVYYSKYFTNRKKIASYAQRYQGTFVNSKFLADQYLAQIASIEKKLGSIKQQIDTEEAKLEAESNQLEADRQTATSREEFNARVNVYNAEVQSYKSLIFTYNSLIEQHNALVDKYQKLTIETNQLIKELDSRSSSVSSQ